MSDWDTQPLKIGSKAKNQRETVVKGKGALNAAMRTGSIVATEKKYTVGNAATKLAPEGQRLTKVDRSDDIVKPNTIGPKVGKAIAAARNNLDSPLALSLAKASGREGDPKAVTQTELANAIGMKATDLREVESGNASRQSVNLQKIERQLGVKLTGSEELIGTPLPEKGKKGDAKGKGKK